MNRVGRAGSFALFTTDARDLTDLHGKLALIGVFTFDDGSRFIRGQNFNDLLWAGDDAFAAGAAFARINDRRTGAEGNRIKGTDFHTVAESDAAVWTAFRSAV